MAFVSLPCGQSLKLLIGKATDLWPYFCRSSNRSTNTSTSSCFTFPDPVFHLGTTTLAAFLSSFSTYKNLLCPKIERKEHLLAVNNWMSKHYFEMFCSIKGTFFLIQIQLTQTFMKQLNNYILCCICSNKTNQNYFKRRINLKKNCNPTFIGRYLIKIRYILVLIFCHLIN